MLGDFGPRLTVCKPLPGPLPLGVVREGSARESRPLATGLPNNGLEPERGPAASDEIGDSADDADSTAAAVEAVLSRPAEDGALRDMVGAMLRDAGKVEA
jgi:hypothetical protein